MDDTRLDLHNLTILLGESSATGTITLKAMLREAFGDNTRLIDVESLVKVREELVSGGIDIIVLDFSLLSEEGIKAVESLRATTMAPIVVLGKESDKAFALDTLRAGAEDFIYEATLTTASLWRTISFAIERNKTRLTEMERLHLLELREDFMLTLTHDLKNPLIGSNRLLELIAEGNIMIPAEQQANLLLQVRDSNKNLLNMIQSLNEVYKYEKDLQELHLENTDLLALVNHYLRSVRHLMEDKRIITHVVNNARDAVVLADSLSISRVVQNLIENAIKFSPVEGRVEIKLVSEDDHVTIKVSDEGPGIEPQDLHKLFMRFYQGRSGRNYNYGMGIGLYLCRQIVEAHQGKIWCAPREENGAEFTVALPAMTRVT